MTEIRMRIKARKVARNLEIARATIDGLKASRDSTSSAPSKSSKKSIEQDKKEVGKKIRALRGAKKVTASQITPGVTDVEPPALIDAVLRKSKTESTGTQETTVTTVPTRGRISKRTVAEDREDAALSTLKYSAITGTGSHVSEPIEDVLDTALGIALVASALGKKLPRVTPTTNISPMTECYAELAPARKKSQTPKFVAPPNPIDSVDAGHGDTESEVRLSQSDLHIRFPGDICGMTAISVAGDGTKERFVTLIAKNDGVAVFGTAMSGVAAHEEVGDAPTAPGEVATPVSGSVDAEGKISITPDASRTPTTTPVVPGSEEEKVARKVKYDNQQKMLREIAANQLLQEELAKADPNLVSVSSFLNRVCGTGKGAQLLKETAELFIQRGVAEKVMGESVKQKGTTCEEDGVSDQGEAILILNPTTVSAELKEFTGEHNVVVAMGEPSNPKTWTILVAGQTCETKLCGIATATDAQDDSSQANDGTVRVGDIVAHRLDKSDAISLDGTVMSIGGSSSEGSTAHSTCGSSVSASESRKCAADESPDRKHEGSSRRDIPGRVKRSAARCRVYIPPMVDDKSDCPDRIMNDDGTCTTRITVGQGSEEVTETAREDYSIIEATAAVAPSLRHTRKKSTLRHRLDICLSRLLKMFRQCLNRSSNQRLSLTIC